MLLFTPLLTKKYNAYLFESDSNSYIYIYITELIVHHTPTGGEEWGVYKTWALSNSLHV